MILAGCALPAWYKDGAGQADFNVDKGQCNAQAYTVSSPEPFQRAVVFDSCMQGKGWTRK